jgi:hypothetical protein
MKVSDTERKEKNFILRKAMYSSAVRTHKQLMKALPGIVTACIRGRTVIV